MNDQVLAEEYDFWVQTLGLRRFEPILDLLPPNANRVLDAGSGPGHLALLLADHVGHVVGVDISRAMIGLAERHRVEQQKSNVSWTLGDLEHAAFAPDSFDFIVSTNTLHCARLETALPGLRRLLRPGGRLVVSDVASSWPRWHGSPAGRIFRALMGAPGYAFAHGLRTMWRILRFQMRSRRAWPKRKQELMTPQSFRAMYSQFFPGCRFERSRWNMTAFWEKPKDV